MTVTSRDLPQAQPVARRGLLADVAGGLLLLAFGAGLWLPGAKFTLTGWVQGINLLLSWLKLPAQVPMPDGWWVLLCVPLGLVYSAVEVRLRPGALTAARWRRWAVLLACLLLALLSDVGSTYLGAITPAPDAWPLTRAIAASPTAATVAALLLTFAPEQLILGGWRLIVRG